MMVDEESLTTSMDAAWDSRGFSMASISIVVGCICNYVATIPSEVKHVWGSWSFGSIMYLLTRYTSLFSLLINGGHIFKHVIAYGGSEVRYEISHTARGFFVIANEDLSPSAIAYFSGVVVLMMSMVLLQVRTHALLGKSRAAFVTFIVLDILGLATFITLQVLLTGTDIEPLIWVPLTIIEFVTLIFTLKRTFAVYKLSHGTNWNMPPLIAHLIRDNILYFAIIIVLYGLGVLLTFHPFADTWDGSIKLQFLAAVAASGIIAPNLYLNLKKVNERESKEVVELCTMSDIRYTPVSRAGSEDSGVF